MGYKTNYKIEMILSGYKKTENGSFIETTKKGTAEALWLKDITEKVNQAIEEFKTKYIFKDVIYKIYIYDKDIGKFKYYDTIQRMY